MQAIEQMQDSFLSDNLQRMGNILVATRSFFVLVAHRPQFSFEPRAVEGSHKRCSIIPSHSNSQFVMHKVAQVELECIPMWPNNPSEIIDEFRFAIRGEPHHLVFIAV